MDDRALAVLLLTPDAPFCIEQDVPREFRLAVFDFTGSGHVPELKQPADHAWSAAVAGKGAALRHIVAQPEFSGFDYCAFIDHDVLLSVSDINRLLFIGRAHGLDLFQPSLSHDSYISHIHLAHRPGRIVRETTFVETMTPFFSARALDAVRDVFEECVSGYGLDYVWSSRISGTDGKLAVIDAVLAKHMQPVTSFTRRFDTGETPLAELQRTLARHGLQDYELR